MKRMLHKLLYLCCVNYDSSTHVFNEIITLS